MSSAQGHFACDHFGGASVARDVSVNGAGWVLSCGRAGWESELRSIVLCFRLSVLVRHLIQAITQPPVTWAARRAFFLRLSVTLSACVLMAQLRGGSMKITVWPWMQDSLMHLRGVLLTC